MMDDSEHCMATKMRSVRRIRRALPRALFGLFAFSLALATVSSFSAASFAQSHAKTHRASKGAICGNPKVACKTSVPFEPHDLPFRVPEKAVIFDTELFYAIILKSLPTKEEDCGVFVPEAERTAAQALFPDRKVFTSRCADPGEPESGMLFYTNLDPKFRVMAVYAGTTPAESKRVLAAVKATGKFPGAYVRRMRTGFNGT
jgi:hypothetical protein